MTSDLSYFPQIYDIWTLYEKKKIGLNKRNELLEPGRTKLHNHLKSSDTIPTKIIAPKSPEMTRAELNQLTADYYGVSVEEIE